MEAPVIRWRMVREGGVRFDGRLRGPKCVAEAARDLLEGEPQEVFGVLYLSTQHRIEGVELITRGILDASLVHPREILRGAILHNAAGIILFHNHPSGDPTPSIEDRQVTKNLRKAAEVVGIPLLDHVVLGRERFASLAERGELD